MLAVAAEVVAAGVDPNDGAVAGVDPNDGAAAGVEPNDGAVEAAGAPNANEDAVVAGIKLPNDKDGALEAGAAAGAPNDGAAVLPKENPVHTYMH